MVASSEDDDPRWFYSTVDPTIELEGRPVPALTSLLYRVCTNDPDKFGEACRLLRLFAAEASRLELARK